MRNRKTWIVIATWLAGASIVLAGCSGSGGSSSNGNTTGLTFNTNAITVNAGSSSEVFLTLNESGISGLKVAIGTTNNGIATVTPGECILSSESNGPNSCEILVNGLSNGTANITAMAAGFNVIPVTATVQNSNSPAIPGTLSFSKSSESIAVGSTNYVYLSLNGSTGVSNLVVTLSSSKSSIAKPAEQTCTLSSGLNRKCEVTVDGVAVGSADITATATGYSSPTPMLANVESTANAGTISFSNTAIYTSPGSSAEVLLSLNDSSGVSNLHVDLATAMKSIATVSPESCTLSSGKQNVRSCTLKISGIESGSTSLTAKATGYTITPATVYVESTSYARTFTIQNNCESTIWVGSTGGSTDSLKADGTDSGSTSCGTSNPGTVCPSGSTCTNSGKAGWICYFNPLKNPTNNYAIAPKSSLILGVPSSSYDPGNDFVWSGNMFARQLCDANGNCVVANCNTVNGGTDMTCTAGAQPPVTLAEITMLRKNPDSYDISIENGLNVGASFGPNNTTYTSSQTPFSCGIAGSTSAATSGGTTINASSWTFSPSGVDPDSINAITAPYFTWVSGDGTGTPCPDGTGCSNGDSCGYTESAVLSLNPTANVPPPANYKLTCGKQLGYWSAAQIWFFNQNTSTNLAPFKFGLTNGNSPYNNATLYACATPPLYSGYSKSTGQTPLNTCGATDWKNIATLAPGYSVQESNPNWHDIVLPNITWTKQGCPSCYTYPYDDASSSFTCDNTTAGSATPPNSTNYTVTFCPNN